MKPEFETQLAQIAGRVNAALDAMLSDQPSTGERHRPPSLLAAMRHGVLNGGKRVRPFLVIQSAALFGIEEDASMPTACALECLHCYSLIHDDLPAMDDDDTRRGKPTVHKAFDEATAILAGDALLTLAFDLITDEYCHDDPEIRAGLANLLARAAGVGGMVGGQVLDIAAETDPPDEDGIRQLQSMKTGALIRFACEAGALLGRASNNDRLRLVRYGEIIGLAFQLADDLLDVTANSETIGKATGKDARLGKGTLVGIYGVPKTQAMLKNLQEEANDVLEPFRERGAILRKTARFIVERQR